MENNDSEADLQLDSRTDNEVAKDFLMAVNDVYDMTKEEMAMNNRKHTFFCLKSTNAQ